MGIGTSKLKCFSKRKRKSQRSRRKNPKSRRKSPKSQRKSPKSRRKNPRNLRKSPKKPDTTPAKCTPKKTVGQCGMCQSSDQCAEGFCCPYMKKCVATSRTPC